MKVSSDITNEEIESLYIKYEESSDKSLNLPRSFKNLRLGLLPRICQFFITVLKRNSTVSLKFFQLQVDDKQGITELTEDPQSLTAILMAESVFGKDKVESGQIRKVELKSNMNQALQFRLNNSVYKKGHRVQLFAVDHSVPKYAYPTCFYSPVGSTNLKQSGFFSTLIQKFIKSTVTESVLSNEDTDSLGEMIFEIVENTDQHSKVDYENGKQERSVRAVVIDHKMMTENQQSSNVGGDNTAITDYLESLRQSNRTVHLLEISLFDSGQGIARNLASKLNLNILNVDEEARAISASFAKGITSKANDKGFGRGLHNVRKVLNERNGFISIRTGRVALYRDFNTDSLFEQENEFLSLYDETSKTLNEFTELSAVEGLACSILVPLR